MTDPPLADTSTVRIAATDIISTTATIRMCGARQKLAAMSRVLVVPEKNIKSAVAVTSERERAGALPGA